MKKIQLPEEVVRLYGLSEELLSQRAIFLIVFDLLKQQKIGSEKAAQLLGISRHDILDLMGDSGLPVVNYSPQALDFELRQWSETPEPLDADCL